jgi:KilA-N domain
MSKLTIRGWNGKNIRQRDDGFMSATDMCAAEGKLFGDWSRQKSTKEYLKALIDKHYGDSHNGPIESNVGGLPETTGTWVDRRVALRLAQWISPQFAVQVDEWVEELMTMGTASISEPEPRQMAPQRDLLDYLEAAKSIGIDQDPLILPLLTQRFAEELGAKTTPLNRQVLVAVRAGELGVSQKLIGNGTAIGSHIKAAGFVPNGKTPHGRYNVNTYPPSVALDNAILNFFAESKILEVA